jgi:outer membrane protein TolC
MAETVSRARATSYALAAVDKRVADARTYIDRSSAWLASNPFFSGGASASDSTFERGTNNPDVFRTERYGPSYTFTLQQDFEVAGQRSARIRAAERGLDVVISDRRNTEATVDAEAKKLFTAALESDAKVVFAERSTRLIQGVNAGFDRHPESDKERIAFNSSTMQLHRRRRREGGARRARDEAHRQLKRVIGVPLDMEVVLDGALEQRPRKLPPLRDLMKGLADRRADVAAYRSLLERTEAELTLAKRLAVPDISIFGFVSRFDGGDGDDETSGGGSLGFNLPVFQGNGPSIDDAISERQRAAVELDDLIRLVESNLATAYGQTLDAAAELQTVVEEIIPRARENVELQQRRAQRGEVRSFDIVDYEIELVSAEEELVTAQRVYTDALIELEKAAAVPLVPPDNLAPAAQPASTGEDQKTENN